ncbi:hypothetical protein AB1Y20_020002 [Prymnesium parvum]|uniref:Uncharacterized protein n=1 Tax=Prymnesium parvum TaxID=97485 RepID=A0AB34JWS8_PRYPA
MLCQGGFSSVRDLNEWTGKALLDEKLALQLKGEWKPSTSGEAGWPLKNKVSTSPPCSPRSSRCSAANL